jgi:hypothetical protein
MSRRNRKGQLRLGRSSYAHSQDRGTSLFENLEQRRLLSGGTWTTLTNNVPGGDGAGLMMLLSDGTVMAHGGGATNKWYKLTPDSTGNYVNGTWSPMGNMNANRLYFGSNVLPSGRVFVVGGEYGDGDAIPDDLNSAEIYDPTANVWSNVNSFPRAEFGDDPTQLLGNGKIVAGYISGPETYLYDPASNSWSQTGTKRNNDRSDEETWMLLPDGSVLSYDIFSSYSDPNANHAQRYNWASGQWTDAGNPPILLSADNVGYELGPALLLPDGRALFVGGLNAVEYYSPNTNVWTTAPPMPNGYVAADAPGAMLPNGNVLLAGSPQGPYDPQTHVYTWPHAQKLFEFNPTTGVYLDVTPSNVPTTILSTTVNAYYDNMLVLPTGQVLVSQGGGSVAVYTPTGGPQQAWKPTISSITYNGGNTFTLSGTQLNGMSEGASYGDDNEMSENYPIVSFNDGLGHVTYARTHDWSNVGVQTGNLAVSTKFDVAGIPSGARVVTVSAAGISSDGMLDIEGTSGNDNISVTNHGSTIQVVMNGGPVQTFATNSFTKVLINGADGSDQISFDGVSTATATIRGGNGDDQILIAGGSQDLSTLSAQNQVEGNAGNDTLILLDDNSTAGHTYNVDQSAISRDGGAAVQYAADVENVTLDDGRGNDTVNVSSTRAGIVTVVSDSGGNDTFNVGGANGVQSINGFLNLGGIAGSTQMNINDAGDFTGRNITMAQSDSDHGLIFGLAPSNIIYQYSRTSNLTLIAGTGADTVSVYATGAPTTISNDQTDDRVFVGDGTNGVQGIKGALLVTNPVDDTILTISDAVDATGRQFTLDNDGTIATLTGMAPAPIRWNMLDCQNVNMTSGSALDVFLLHRSMYNLNYDGNNGSDNIFIGANSGVGLQGISGTVSLTNTISRNFLQFNDDEDTTARNIAVTNVNVGGADYQQSTGLIPGTVRYKTADTAGVSYFTGQGADTISIPATNVPLHFGSAGGNDSLTVGNGSLQGITATVGVLAYGSKMNMTLDDSADTTARTINHDLIPSGSTFLGQFTGVAPAPVQYDVAAVNSVTLRPGAATDTINVNETGAAIPVTIRNSTGFDTLNVNTDGAGSAQVLFNETQKIGALNVGTGGKATMAANGSNVLSTRTLLLAGGAKLDLTNNDMILDYTGASPLANVVSMIGSARNGGSWNGTTGITSSTAAAANPKNTTLGTMEATDYKAIYGASATFDGQAIDTTAVLIKYTWYGDADFNGKVNFDDYVRTDSGFNNHKTGWSNGDFDGNGQVNFDDYVLIDLAFNTQGGLL